MHAAHTRYAETLKRSFDRASLRIENPFARGDVNARLRANQPPKPSLTLDSPQHLLVRLFNVTQVTAEAIFIELLARLFIPEAAGIGTNLVAQQDFTMMTTEFEFEIDQQNAAFVEKRAQQLIDPKGHFVDLAQLIFGGPVKENRMISGN